jgi:hypothetical protein
MERKSGGGRDQDDHGDVLSFGRDRPPGRPWLPRALLAGLVLAAVVTVVVRTVDQPARHPARAAAPVPARRVISVGHRLLGVTAGWQLFARGPADLLRIELARGRVSWTYVPALETASPDIAFVIGAHEAIIRPADYVPGYVVPDDSQARMLTGPLAGSGPVIPGPAGSQAAWVATGPPTSPRLSLMTLGGHRDKVSITFPVGGPQLPATAVSDGRGDVLVTSSDATVYDAGPGWDRAVPGSVIAVGPGNWLTVICNNQFRHCSYADIDSANGTQRTLPAAVAPAPYYFTWPPTGVISPDGRIAAVGESEPNGMITVRLISLRTGRITNLRVALAEPGGPTGGSDASEASMTWSPDSRWLFVAAAGGKLDAVSALTGRVHSLGVRLPAVSQVAIRP